MTQAADQKRHSHAGLPGYGDCCRHLREANPLDLNPQSRDTPRCTASHKVRDPAIGNLKDESYDTGRRRLHQPALFNEYFPILHLEAIVEGASRWACSHSGSRFFRYSEPWRKHGL